MNLAHADTVSQFAKTFFSRPIFSRSSASSPRSTMPLRLRSEGLSTTIKIPIAPVAALDKLHETHRHPLRVTRGDPTRSNTTPTDEMCDQFAPPTVLVRGRCTRLRKLFKNLAVGRNPANSLRFLNIIGEIEELNKQHADEAFQRWTHSW